MQNRTNLQKSSRKVHAADSEEQVFNVKLPEILPPGVSLAGFGTGVKNGQSRASTALADAKRQLARRQQRAAKVAFACKCFSSFCGGSLALAGSIVILVGLVDLLTLAPSVQANCELDSFEYPGGYPPIEDPSNSNPCPRKPSCMFQVRSSLDGGRMVRHWNVPFVIPEMKPPGEPYLVDPPHESLSCCGVTPGNCCDWYHSNTTSWCDSSNKPNCPQGPWPCYFEQVKFYNGDEEAGEIDGSYMKVGEKTRSLPILFAGVGCCGSGLLILTMWIKRFRETCFWCIDTLTSWLKFKIWIWSLKAIKRIPRWMLPEDLVDWWTSETQKILFVQRCIRHWIERKRNKEQFVLAKGIALWQNEAVKSNFDAEDLTKNERRLTVFVPTEKDQDVNRSSSDASITEKHRKRKKGSSNSTGSSESTTTPEGPARQKSGGSKEKDPAKAAAAPSSGEQASQEEKLSETGETLRPEERVSERAEAQGQELVDKMLPKATKKSKSRRLLYDSGNMHDFKRFSRVRVVSEPWERLCVEVALEEGAPQFGAFVRVVELAPSDTPVPPVVSRVQPCSMAADNGLQPGFLLLKVNRLEWPNFPAEEMVQELQSGRRPLFLVLQEPETRATRERERLVQAGYTSLPLPPPRPSSASRPLPPGAPSSSPSAPEVAPPAMPEDYDLETAAIALPGEAAAPQFDSPSLNIRNSNGSVRPTAELPKRPHSAGNHASNMRMAEAARHRRRPMSAAAAGMAGRDSSLSRAQNWQGQLSVDGHLSGTTAAHLRSNSGSIRRGRDSGGGATASSQRRPSGMSYGGGSNAGRHSRPGSAASAGSSSHVAQGNRRPGDWVRQASAGSGSSKQPGGGESDQRQQQQRKRPSSAAAAVSRPPPAPSTADPQLARRKTVETSEALGKLLGF
eukprot:TRINITY_DN19319_c0_g1_i2.p1 TRINITY_DN19319_c0_g1~~TRINITY_DN19319_c0_g1_i2.p1  ORF type:complete len:904 (-),score=169.97 TRINITY_DN19319_c0_g1_i2:453-3164(-)